jgi:hypothetical protein
MTSPAALLLIAGAGLRVAAYVRQRGPQLVRIAQFLRLVTGQVQPSYQVAILAPGIEPGQLC